MKRLLHGITFKPMGIGPLITWIAFALFVAGFIHYAIKSVLRKRGERREQAHRPHGMPVGYDYGAMARSASEGISSQGDSTE